MIRDRIVIFGLLLVVLSLQGYLMYELNIFGSEEEKEKPLDIYTFVEQSGFNNVSVRIDWKSTCSFESFNNVLYSGYSGLYDPRTDTITLCPSGIEGSPIGTLWHEYGHHIWYQSLSDEQIDWYIEIYETSREFASGYAITGGVEEDFAETIEAYKLGKLDLITSERRDFIDAITIEGILV